MKKSLFCRRRQERDLFFGGRSWTEAPLDEAEFNEYMQQYVLFYEFFRYQMVELGEKTILSQVYDYLMVKDNPVHYDDLLKPVSSSNSALLIVPFLPISISICSSRVHLRSSCKLSSAFALFLRSIVRQTHFINDKKDDR